MPINVTCLLRGVFAGTNHPAEIALGHEGQAPGKGVIGIDGKYLLFPIDDFRNAVKALDAAEPPPTVRTFKLHENPEGGE